MPAQRPQLLPAAAGLALIGALAWLLLGSGSNGSAPEAGPSSTTPPATTPAVSPEEETEAGLEIIAQERVEGQPFLGEETGWSLLVTDATGPRLIDLDRSDARAVDGLDAWTVTASGDHLVAINSRFVYSVPLADLEDGDQVVLGAVASEGLEPAAMIIADEPGLIWFRTTSYPQNGLHEWQLVELATGEVVEERSHEAAGVPRPDLAGTSSGGVWLVEDDGFRQLVPGRLVAATGELALVVSCSTPEDCELTWYERPSWQEIDLPVPDGAASLSYAHILGSRLLIHAGSSDAGILDLRSGAQLFDGHLGGIFENRPLGGLHARRTLALSPDGRYLVVGELGGQPVIHDLETGHTWDLSPLTTPGFSSAVFVDRDLVDAAHRDSAEEIAG